MKFSFKKLLSFSLLLAATILAGAAACHKGGSGNGGGTDTTGNEPAGPSDVAMWLTSSDQAALLQKQNLLLQFGTGSASFPTITVDSTKTYQSIDGFGYALTGGSAGLIHGLDATTRGNLLRELFGTDSNSIGISYLRISIGSSDLNASVFSYDDMPPGQTDTGLQHFSIQPDETDLVPVLQEILTIRPGIKILGSPWSAPAWMKDNDGTVGGSLKPAFYEAYARYFVKYIAAMKADGIDIDAVTPQNEPLNPNNNPSMVMTAVQEDSFVRFNLGPALVQAGLSTKIIVWDHNCDVPQYPLTILADTAARKYVDGSAFHLYAGDISALSQVHDAYPDKNLYFTEQYTGSASAFSDDLKWSVKNVVIGAARNWSRNALEWNLANDPNYGPHTPGGCTTCKGALTIGGAITRNVSYYIIGHASKFVPPGSVRIASNIPGSLNNVAFLRPDGKKVLIVENDDNMLQSFNISFKGRSVLTHLNGGCVATYLW